MKFLLTFLLAVIGAFLIGMTIDDIGDFGNFVMNIIGVGMIISAGLIVNRKKGREKDVNST